MTEKMTDQQQRVNKLIERVEAHQKALALNDTRFVMRYRKRLRSPDSWRRGLCARDWDRIGRTLDKWEAELNQLVALLDGGQQINEYYEQLPIAQYGQNVFDLLQGQTTDRRVAFLIAPTGVGKSYVMKWLALKNPGEVSYVYANECWAESMGKIAKGMAEQVGAVIDKTSGKTTFENVTESLAQHPITMCLDDWQKTGVLGMKLIKSLVDATRARFILGVYPSSFATLISSSSAAWSEAQQIIGRAVKPIHREWMKGVTKADVVAYLSAAGVKGDLDVGAGRMHKDVQDNGNLRVLADAVTDAKLSADEDDYTLDTALVEKALTALCPPVTPPQVTR